MRGFAAIPRRWGALAGLLAGLALGGCASKPAMPLDTITSAALGPESASPEERLKKLLAQEQRLNDVFGRIATSNAELCGADFVPAFGFRLWSIEDFEPANRAAAKAAFGLGEQLQVYAVAAGQPISFTISGLPHHSPIGRNVALVLAVVVVLAGVLLGGRTTEDTGATRKHLVARREKLFQELVRLEHDHRRGKADGHRYTARREELLAALEHVYGALETEGSPDPAGRSGVAA